MYEVRVTFPESGETALYPFSSREAAFLASIVAAVDHGLPSVVLLDGTVVS